MEAAGSTLESGDEAPAGMKVHCCYTLAHEVLFREYFRPSLPVQADLTAHLLDISGPGNFLSQEFLQCIREKMRLIRASIAAHPGEVILWTDVDILIVGDIFAEILPAFEEDPRLCLLFQREAKRLSDVNTGVVAMRCGAEADAFFERVQQRLQAESEKNEQAVVNDLLFRDRDAVRWDYLPFSFYARTHGWPPPADVVLYHANYTKGADAVGQKISQFREFLWIRKFGTPALVWSLLKRLPGRILRIFSGKE